MPDRILITGGAGFIGSFLAEHLAAKGHAIRVLDSLDPQVHPQGSPSYLPPAVEMRIGDVRDKQAVVAALDGVDVVIHCAAAVGVAQSLYRVQHYVDTNVGGAAVVLEAIAERRQPLRKLLIPTSMTGYGEGVYRRCSDGAFVRPDIRTDDDVRRHGWEPVDPTTADRLEAVGTPEDAALRARNVYALTKRYQEELALSLGRVYGFPVVCLRLFNVYGPRQALTNPYTGVLAIFLSRLLAGQPPLVYEDGNQTRDFVSVHDVVRAAALAIDHPTLGDVVLNIGTGIARRIADVARDLAVLVGRPDLAPAVSGRFRVGDVRHCYADARRAEERLGFTPAVDWQDSLAEILAWARSAPTGDHFDRADGELRARGLVR
jgi:dTDP-L-rhamnose 4-epimerase